MSGNIGRALCMNDEREAGNCVARIRHLGVARALLIMLGRKIATERRSDDGGISWVRGGC